MRFSLAESLRPIVCPHGLEFDPSSDSARTMVTPATAAALMVIDLPRGPQALEGAHALDLTARRILEFAGGRETLRLAV
jgi:hypothetical protein